MHGGGDVDVEVEFSQRLWIFRVAWEAPLFFYAVLLAAIPINGSGRSVMILLAQLWDGDPGAGKSLGQKIGVETHRGGLYA